MTRDNAARKARAADLATCDHFPSCPHCGEACGRLARVCADCGSFLYEPTPEDRNMKRDIAVWRRLWMAAPEREDTEATRERGH